MLIIEYKPGDPFPGKIGKTIENSSEAWQVPKRAKSGAPKVLFDVLDEIAFTIKRLEFQRLVKEVNLVEKET